MTPAETALMRECRELLAGMKPLWTPSSTITNIIKRIDTALSSQPPEPSAEKIRLVALERLHRAVLPFVALMRGTSGRIPIERLSFANWHELTKAHDNCPPPDLSKIAEKNQ